jgi:outer membrane lipoprotein carrier protein
LKLDPAKYAGQFTRMDVWLSKKDFSPVRLYTEDPAGNASWYNITDLKVVKDVSNDDFKYKPVPGVDEIDMR